MSDPAQTRHSRAGIVRALVFDFDGLILDTETPQYVSWRETYEAHGVELPLDVYADCLGRPHQSVDFYEVLEQQLGHPIDRDAARAVRKPRMRALMDAERVRPGVVQFLQDADRLGLKVGLASGSDREWVDGHLQRLGLRDHFDSLICAEDTRTHKPDPEPFAVATRALGVAPHEAIALEDSPNGIASAKAAGLLTVAVPNPVTAPIDLTHADLVIESMEDVPLTELIERLTR